MLLLAFPPAAETAAEAWEVEAAWAAWAAAAAAAAAAAGFSAGLGAAVATGTAPVSDVRSLKLKDFFWFFSRFENLPKGQIIVNSALNLLLLLLVGGRMKN